MLNFVIISTAVFVGMMASYAIMLALAVNKTAMKKLTKKYMEIGKEISKESFEDEDFKDWLM